jgi:hypothetical protein
MRSIHISVIAMVFALNIAFADNQDRQPGPDFDCRADAVKPQVHCGTTPTAVFDENGRLWVVFEHEDFVYVVYSEDNGQTFGQPVRVNEIAEPLYTNGENRPKIAIGNAGEIFVSWTKITEGRFAGDIRFSRSLDGGRKFEPLITVNDDGLVTSHRFESIFVNSTGSVFITWIDKRDLLAARAAGRAYDGAAVYYTVSNNSGATFAVNRNVTQGSCECCRIAMAEDEKGDVAIFVRHIFGDNIRDHGFAVLGRDDLQSPLVRVTRDDWQIEACPHHGPAMIFTGGDGYHLTWYTGGTERKGVYYGYYESGKGQVHNLASIAPSASASHPFIAEVADRLMLVWKEFDGEKTNIKLVESVDEGHSWGAAQSIATTIDASDHPFILTHGDNAYLSWHTSREGLRIMPMINTSERETR